jgi:site-specific recombinase XerD
LGREREQKSFEEKRRRKSIMGVVFSEAYADIYQSFLAYAENRVTKQGYETLVHNTRTVMKWFETEDILLSDATIQDALAYRATESRRVKKDGNLISSGTVANRLKAARSLFHWMVLEGLRTTSPFDEVKNPHIAEPLSRNVLNEGEMGILLEKLSRFHEIKNRQQRLRRYRFHVIAELLYASGLRIAEASNLIPDNLDLRQRLIYVPEGKGEKARIAFLSGYACDVLSCYLKEGRNAILGNYERPYGHLLFGANKSRIGIVVNEDLAIVCRELEIPVITSHGFRYSVGTHLLRHKCDMRHIQAILGHERLATTQIYTKVDKDEIKESLDTFHPRRLSE